MTQGTEKVGRPRCQTGCLPRLCLSAFSYTGRRDLLNALSLPCVSAGLRHGRAECVVATFPNEEEGSTNERMDQVGTF